MALIMIRPEKAVVPIFETPNPKASPIFLGTGFFILPDPILVTANHVIQNSVNDLCIAVIDKSIKLFRAFTITNDDQRDLALLKVPDYHPEFSFMLGSPEKIVFNKPVISYDYGTTESIEGKIKLSPATRIGNIVRTLDLVDLYDKAGEEILELSFPVLRGASGGPLFGAAGEDLIWGILKGNVAHELSPAQIEKIYDEEGKVEEETRFLLPQGLAVHVGHLRELLTRQKITH
ncbi:serine protease [Candidatus Neomarinimicrobiota bacterium]